MSDELKPPRDVIAENAARQCTPQNKGPITWALSSVMREFAREDGLEDVAHDALVDAVSRVIATYDKHAKESRPTPEHSGEARDARSIASYRIWAIREGVATTTLGYKIWIAAIDAAMDRSALGREGSDADQA